MKEILRTIYHQGFGINTSEVNELVHFFYNSWHWTSSAMDEVYLQWPDYLIVAIVLTLSAAIGFYYACTGDKQRTTKEYLLADGNMHWFPVACSLLAR